MELIEVLIGIGSVVGLMLLGIVCVCLVCVMLIMEERRAILQGWEPAIIYESVLRDTEACCFLMIPYTSRYLPVCIMIDVIIRRLHNCLLPQDVSEYLLEAGTSTRDAAWELCWALDWPTRIV